MRSAGIWHASRIATWMLVCVFMVSASGCAVVGQDYARPDIPLSDAWNTRLNNGSSKSEPDPQELASWWKALDDPILTGLMDTALENNLDVKKAKERLRQARAERSTVQAGLFPTLDASGSATRSRSSQESGAGSSRTMYSAGFDAGWEIDLFGGVRRSVEAAEADLQASSDTVNDVLVSLTAEVALNYLQLRMYQARLDVAEKNLGLQEETYQLERYRFLAGLSDELAVAQARSNMENTRSRIPTLNIQVEQAKNGIAVLLGEQPGARHEDLAGHSPLPVIPTEMAIGVPADILRRRPDVRQAEQELAAQTARVGVAQSDLYPKITLNGSIGYEALSAGDLITAGARAWSYGPRITWPIFRAGSIRANIEVQSALQEQALIHYESVVLSALEEVENALVSYVEEQIRRESLDNAATAARQAVDCAQNTYDAGLIDFDTLLDSQRTQLSYEDELAQSESAVIMNLVRVYKALGGGWTSMAPETDPLISSQGEPFYGIEQTP
ncbi:MAG: efflux transporter outer membrane subunit [Desulfomonilia bacterium]